MLNNRKQIAMNLTTLRQLVAKLCLLSLISSLLACAGIPAQQMSDARQAISAAELVLSLSSQENEVVRQAQVLLERAEYQLRLGNNDEAKDYALRAKRLAIEAREAVIGDRPNP